MDVPSSTLAVAEQKRGPDLLKEFVVAWRQRTGLSVTKAALECGVDPAQFTKFMRGERRPGLDNALLMDKWSDGCVPANSWPPLERKPATTRAEPRARRTGTG